MPKFLSQSQIDQYHRDGCLFPITVMSEKKAYQYEQRLAGAEKAYPKELNAHNRNNAHLVFPFLDEIVRHPLILDIVEDLIGEDILVWGSVLFVKEPQSAGHVTWHQDYTYMGLAPHDGVSVWIAFTPSNKDSGCMQILPGSHLEGIHPHRDSFGKDNILTRGQTIDGLDVSNALDVVLAPGQISLHHPRVIHGSDPNRSDYRRVGFTIQTYLPPHVRSTKSVGHAMLVRGKDRGRHHQLLAQPTFEMEPEGVAVRAQVNKIREVVLYEGSDGKRRC